MGRKKWEANRSKKKRWHLEWDGKNGKQRDQKKRWHLEGLQEKTVILQTWIGKKKLEANRSKKNSHLEWDGKNGKQIDKKKGGILNGTEKMGRKELEEKTAI